MGAPAETYRYGSMQAINVLTYIVLVPAVSHLYVPMFHRLQVASSFEVIATPETDLQNSLIFIQY